MNFNTKKSKRYYGVLVPEWFELNDPPSKPREKVRITIKEESFSNEGKLLIEIIEFTKGHPPDKVEIQGSGDEYGSEITVECFDIIDNPHYKKDLLKYEKKNRIYERCKIRVEKAIAKGVDRWEGVPSYERPLISNFDFFLKPSIGQELFDINAIEQPIEPLNLMEKLFNDKS